MFPLLSNNISFLYLKLFLWSVSLEINLVTSLPHPHSLPVPFFSQFKYYSVRETVKVLINCKFIEEMTQIKFIGSRNVSP